MAAGMNPFPRKELPPRARRIPGTRFNTGPLMGTTSACAENTLLPEITDRQIRNYLRVRGEYQTMLWLSPHHRELPPRARRILPGQKRGAHRTGTTSACAENTAGDDETDDE